MYNRCIMKHRGLALPRLTDRINKAPLSDLHIGFYYAVDRERFVCDACLFRLELRNWTQDDWDREHLGSWDLLEGE